MKELDLLSVPLEGTTLIEASAGTGKTWSITGLYLRLLLEKKLGVERILAVTFTNAATEELRIRLRNRLRQARQAVSGSPVRDDDALMQSVARRYFRDGEALGILDGALQEFDRAAVFTIHGFCNRLLQEWAFETGSAFDLDLSADPIPLMREVCEDFWRIHLYGAPNEFIDYCAGRLDGPDALLPLLTTCRHPGARVLPRIAKAPLSGLDAFCTLWGRVRKQWPESREAVAGCLGLPSLSKRFYGERRIFEMMEAMDALAAAHRAVFPLSEKFERFTPKVLAHAAKKGAQPPAHAFFDLCGSLWEAARTLEGQMQRRLLFLKLEFFKYAGTEMDKRKNRYRIQFYEDLLLSVQRALCSDGATRLVRSVASRYRAALVDEFQDTDPVQYEIFSRLFSGSGQALFMIGDPKQAIYGFRGADVFSYLKAAQNARARHTLTRNFRSVPGLVRAVNTLFSNVSRPFLIEEIPFYLGSAAAKPEAGDPAPLKIWFLPGRDGKPLTKTEAVSTISEAVGEEIASLVQNRVFEKREIAVLVRTHRQARIVKQALTRKGLSAVLFSDENVFDSHEALELERLLLGIQDPLNPSRAKAALATDLLGFTAQDLYSSQEEARTLEEALARFREYHDLWRSRGFIPMFTRLLRREEVKARLIRYPDGERRMTNLMHLAELFHEASQRHPFAIERLVKWIRERRDPRSPRSETHQLRLESDEDAVTLVTMHRSKGLEYPVVFCPFAWEGPAKDEDALIFHDPDSGFPLVVDFDPESNPKGRAWARKERLAENLRLLYVALTRAKKRCYLVWGKIRTAEASAMVYLFHHRFQGNLDDPGKDPEAVLSETFSRRSEADWLSDLQALVEDSGGCIAVSGLPEKPAGKPVREKRGSRDLSLRRFSGSIPDGWKVSSYSSLAGSASELLEVQDRDAAPEIRAPEIADPKELSSFPAGSRAGRFFHALFESLDFTVSPLKQTDLAAAILSGHGFDTGWKEAVCAGAQRVLSTRLPGAEGTLMLSDLTPADRVHEMEFDFPVKRISPQTLAWAFSCAEVRGKGDGIAQRIERLFFSPREGFMRGFVDLVVHQGGRYYLFDWKSNLLGTGPSAYSRERLARTMEQEYYFLQYHLYVLALCRHLKLKIPGFSYEKNFGGVFYLFIRGMVPDPASGVSETGVFYDLPDVKRIQRLEKALLP